MAATLSLDTLTSAGSGITVAAGKTLTVGGKSVTAGSSNIQRATTDVTVATTADYGVAGKSELVIAANAGAATRTITLCPVTETGVDTCIITVIADADATSTYKLTVVENDGTTVVWTGYQTGDFVRLVVSNSAWLVVDHKATMFSSRRLTADQSIAAGAQTKIIGFTNHTDIGGVWDDTNNKLVAPYAGWWDINWRLTFNTENGNVPVLFVGGSRAYTAQLSSDGAGYNYGQTGSATLRVKVAASTDIEFYSHNTTTTGAYPVHGDGSQETGFDGTFTRTY